MEQPNDIVSNNFFYLKIILSEFLEWIKISLWNVIPNETKGHISKTLT